MTGTGQQPRISTGVAGLDSILHGGLITGRSYLIRGPPGTGKTILGTHFLKAGVENGETSLFINLEESEADVRQNASSLGFDLSDVHFLDLSPTADVFAEDQSYDILSASNVEKKPFTDSVTDTISELEPDRVFVDPITQLRYLTSDTHQFRKQAIGFMEYLTSQGATVMFTSQNTADSPDDDLQFMSDGTIELDSRENVSTINVPKLRGSRTESGTHAITITDDGLVVYPQLKPLEHSQTFSTESISSGVSEIDELLNGGFERGTVSIISGPTGVGKTTLGTQFINNAAARGERSVLYLFEENYTTFRKRNESIGVPVSEMRESGSLHIQEMEPLDVSPQEFAQNVRTEVEEHGAEIVMIDGINGYQLSVQGGSDVLIRKLHALGRYLKNVGVTVIFIDEHQTVTGEFSATNSGVSYLADNLVFLQHVELDGKLQKVIGVLKKRTTQFERTLRKFEITDSGVVVGEPLTGLRGILSGSPEWNTPKQQSDDE
ncbi:MULTISPECIES: ATPase domain-containing protein [Haloferax]|uniref:non-specific serine/threonine protein kinase n=1 Tax=Haloferax marinum TaxID=2666143 RepID=A0A6A8GAR8_9EURY|nr:MULTISPECIES: ATPase domain-containing protein [Haloferax]KAB1191211.1 AAA family ATPase [Haloferax sp. CBA1150]MRW98101.1 AAA family ATPase [Haloferax marinum]